MLVLVGETIAVIFPFIRCNEEAIGNQSLMPVIHAERSLFMLAFVGIRFIE